MRKANCEKDDNNKDIFDWDKKKPSKFLMRKTKTNCAITIILGLFLAVVTVFLIFAIIGTEKNLNALFFIIPFVVVGVFIFVWSRFLLKDLIENLKLKFEKSACLKGGKICFGYVTEYNCQYFDLSRDVKSKKLKTHLCFLEVTCSYVDKYGKTRCCKEKLNFDFDPRLTVGQMLPICFDDNTAVIFLWLSLVGEKGKNALSQAEEFNLKLKGDEVKPSDEYDTLLLKEHAENKFYKVDANSPMTVSGSGKVFGHFYIFSYTVALIIPAMLFAISILVLKDNWGDTFQMSVSFVLIGIATLFTIFFICIILQSILQKVKFRQRQITLIKNGFLSDGYITSVYQETYRVGSGTNKVYILNYINYKFILPNGEICEDSFGSNELLIFATNYVEGQKITVLSDEHDSLILEEFSKINNKYVKSELSPEESAIFNAIPSGRPRKSQVKKTEIKLTAYITYFVMLLFFSILLLAFAVLMTLDLERVPLIICIFEYILSFGLLITSLWFLIIGIKKVRRANRIATDGNLAYGFIYRSNENMGNIFTEAYNYIYRDNNGNFCKGRTKEFFYKMRHVPFHAMYRAAAKNSKNEKSKLAFSFNEHQILSDNLPSNTAKSESALPKDIAPICVAYYRGESIICILD